MSYLLKKNNAKTTINQAGGLNDSDTTVIVTDASQLTSGGAFLVTVWDSDNYDDPTDDSNREILKVTNVSGNTLTIERGQEDTTAHSHSNRSTVAMLITAGHFTEIENAITGSGHDQNTDTILDEDGANEVSAQEIREHIDDTENPHNVTADQIATDDSGETVQDKIDALEASSSHTQNTDVILQRYNGEEVYLSQLDTSLVDYWTGVQLGYTFTPTENIYLSSVDIIVRTWGSSDDCTVEIYQADANHFPTGSALASKTVANADLPEFTPPSFEYTNFAFLPELELTSGQEYVIVITMNGNTVYSYAGDISANFNFVDNSGSGWTTDYDSSEDGIFKIYKLTDSKVDLIENALLKRNLYVDDDVEIDGRDISEDGSNLDSHIADTDNPHNTSVSNVITSLFAQDIEGNIRPMEDYFFQGGFFELDANYNRIPKSSLTGLTDLFFELDINNNIVPKDL